jgi:hypothetical protein
MQRVVVEAAPAAAFEMPKPGLLLELLIVAIDAPVQPGHIKKPMSSGRVESQAAQTKSIKAMRSSDCAVGYAT